MGFVLALQTPCHRFVLCISTVWESLQLQYAPLQTLKSYTGIRCIPFPENLKTAIEGVELKARLGLLVARLGFAVEGLGLRVWGGGVWLQFLSFLVNQLGARTFYGKTSQGNHVTKLHWRVWVIILIFRV